MGLERSFIATRLFGLKEKIKLSVQKSKPCKSTRLERCTV
jgi:hypothetical protein